LLTIYQLFNAHSFFSDYSNSTTKVATLLNKSHDNSFFKIHQIQLIVLPPHLNKKKTEKNLKTRKRFMKIHQELFNIVSSSILEIFC